MTLKMDKAGRIVFPKRLRERLGIRPGMDLEAVEETGGVRLRLVEPQPSMVQVNGLWVHRGLAAPNANWGRVLDDVREDRIQAVLKA